MTGIFHIVVARKPIEGTIVENCLQWGCGAINVDGCRLKYASEGDKTISVGSGEFSRQNGIGSDLPHHKSGWGEWKVNHTGRFPANLILGGEEVVERFPVTNGAHGGHGNFKQHAWMLNDTPQSIEKSDTGSASRFFFNFSEQESDE